MTAADQYALLKAHRTCEEALKKNDPDAYYRGNKRFHMALYAASHNGFLTEEADTLHRRLSAYVGCRCAYGTGCARNTQNIQPL